MGVLPRGYDTATDSLRSSLRVDMAMTSGAQGEGSIGCAMCADGCSAYPMIAMLLIGCTLFSRNSLSGQPELQQSLMKLPVLVGLFSDVSHCIIFSPSGRSAASTGLFGLDRVFSGHQLTLKQVWLYMVLLAKLPREVRMTPAIWTSSIKGIAFGLPVATVLKLVWLFGLGRDVV